MTQQNHAEAQAPNTPEDSIDDDGFATVSGSTVTRDESGDIAPKLQELPELGPEGVDGKVLARPMNNAAREKYLKPLQKGDDLTDAKLAALYNSHIVRPDLGQHPACPNGRVTEDFVANELDPKAEDGYFFAILLASGEERMVELLRKASRGELTEEDVGQTPDEGN